MTDKSRKRKPRKPQYKYHPRAQSVTIYSPDGSPVPPQVMDVLVAHAEELAKETNLLVDAYRA